MARIDPYGWLYELRPISIKAKVIEEVVRHILGDLQTWPPPITDWLDAPAARRFAPLYDEPCRPPPALFRRALQLVRWDLKREHEAIDESMRNERWRDDGGGPQAKLALLLLWQWLTEVLLAVKEHSGQGLSRADLVEIVNALEPHLAPDPLRA